MESKEISNALGVMKKSLCKLESVNPEVLHAALSKLGCVDNKAKHKNGVEIDVSPEKSTPLPEKVLRKNFTPSSDETLRKNFSPTPDETLREKSTPSPSDKDSFSLYLSEESFEEDMSVNEEGKTEMSNESRLPEAIDKEFKEISCQRPAEICNRDCTGESHQASSVANEPVDKESSGANCSAHQEKLHVKGKNVEESCLQRSAEICNRDCTGESHQASSVANEPVDEEPSGVAKCSVHQEKLHVKGKNLEESSLQRSAGICNKNCTGESHQVSSVANEPVDEEPSGVAKCSVHQEKLHVKSKNLEESCLKRSAGISAKDTNRELHVSSSVAKGLLENEYQVNCDVDHGNSLLKPDEIIEKLEVTRQVTNDSSGEEPRDNVSRNVDQGNSDLRPDVVVNEKLNEAPQEPDIISHSNIVCSKTTSNSVDAITVHENSVHANSAHENSVHANSVHASSVHASPVHEISVHENSVHANSVQANSVHENSVHENSVHASSVHANSAHANTSPPSGLSIVGGKKVNDLREKIRAKFTNIKTPKELANEDENNSKMKTHANNNNVQSCNKGNVSQHGTGFLRISNSSQPLRTGFLIIKPGSTTQEQSLLSAQNKFASSSNGVTFQNKPIGSLLKQGKIPDIENKESDSLNVKADSTEWSSGENETVMNKCISKTNRKDKMPASNQTLVPVVEDQAVENCESSGVAKSKNSSGKGNETPSLENKGVVFKSKKKKPSKKDKSQEKQSRISKRRKTLKKDCNSERDKVLEKELGTGKETSEECHGTGKGIEDNKTEVHSKEPKEKKRKKVKGIDTRACSRRLAEKKKKQYNTIVKNGNKVLNKETAICNQSVSSVASDTSKRNKDNEKDKSLDNLSVVIGKQNCGKIQNAESTKKATYVVLNKDKSSGPGVINGVSDNKHTSSTLRAGDQGVILLRISGNQVKVFKSRKDILQTIGSKKRSYVLKTSIGTSKALPRADVSLDKLRSSLGSKDLGLAVKANLSKPSKQGLNELGRGEASTADFAVQFDDSDKDDRNEASGLETVASVESSKPVEEEINNINKKIASFKKKTHKHKNHLKTTLKCKACRYSKMIDQLEERKSRLETKNNAIQVTNVNGTIDVNDTQVISMTECLTTTRESDKTAAVDANQEHEKTDGLDRTAVIVKSKTDNEMPALREEEAVSDKLESCDVVSIDRDLAKQVADYVEKTVTSELFSSSTNDCAVPVEKDKSLTVVKGADCGEPFTIKTTSKGIEEACENENILSQKESSINNIVVSYVQAASSNKNNDKGIVTKPIVTGLSATNSKSFVLLSVVTEDDMSQAENDVTEENGDSIEKVMKAEKVIVSKCKTMRKTNKGKTSEPDTTNSSNFGLGTYLSNCFAWKDIFYDSKLVGRKRKLHESCPLQFAWESPHCFSSRRFVYDKVTVLDKLQKHEVRMQRYKEVKTYNREELYTGTRLDDASRGKKTLDSYSTGSTKAGNIITTSPNGIRHVTEIDYSHESQSISEKMRKRQRRSEGLTEQQVAELLEYRASKGLEDPCVPSGRLRDSRMEKDALSLHSSSNGMNEKKTRKRRRTAKQDKPVDIRENEEASQVKNLLRSSRQETAMNKQPSEIPKEKDELDAAESDRITEAAACESAPEASPESATYSETLSGNVKERRTSMRSLPRKCKQRSNESSARNNEECLSRNRKEQRKTKDSLLGKHRNRKKISEISSREITNDEAFNEALTERGFDIMIKTEPEDASNQDEAFGISVESVCNVSLPISAIDPCDFNDMCDSCDKISSGSVGVSMLSSNSGTYETEENSSSRESTRRLRPRKAKTERPELNESEENSIVDSREVDSSFDSDLSNLALGEREIDASVNDSREENLDVGEIKTEPVEGNIENVELDSASALQSDQLESLEDIVEDSSLCRAGYETHRANVGVPENDDSFDQEASILPDVDKSGSQTECQPKKRRTSRNTVTENSPSSRYHGVLRNRSIKKEAVEDEGQENVVDTVVKTEDDFADCLDTNEELSGDFTAELAEENLHVQRKAEKPKQKRKVGLTRRRLNQKSNKVVKKSINSGVVERTTFTMSNDIGDSNRTRKRRKRSRKLIEMNCSETSDPSPKSSTDFNESITSESHFHCFYPEGEDKDNNDRRRSRRVHGRKSKENNESSGSSDISQANISVEESAADINRPMPDKDPYSLSEMHSTVSNLLSTVTESLNEKSSPSRTFLPCEKCGKFYKCKKDFARHYLHHVIDEAADKEYEDVWGETVVIPGKRCRVDDSSARSENSTFNNQNDYTSTVLTEKCKLASGTGATKITYKANYWQLEKPDSAHRTCSSRDQTTALWTPVNFKVPVKPVKWKCSGCKTKYRRLHELKLHTDVCTGKKTSKKHK